MRLTLCVALAFASTAAQEPRWEEILGPPRGEIAAAQPEVEWRTDLAAALREARDEGRPLFVTLRCLPCKQCASFDQAVLEGGLVLDSLLARFVTVRLTDAAAIDLHLLPVEGFQDLDLSWWGWFLAPEGRVYAVFGGMDHVSDTTRISATALARTMERVLAHHSDPRRAGWDVDGPAPRLEGARRTPRDLDGYASWTRKRDPAEAEAKCLRCHQVAEILRQPAIDARTFDKGRDLDMWPLPENVGLVLDRDDGLRVAEVEPGSFADRAGLRARDSLAAAGGRRLFGQADFRGVLHRGPRGQGSIELWWRRGDALMHGALEVGEGWRATPNAWRASVCGGNYGAHPGFAWPHAAKPEVRRARAIAEGSMAVAPWFGERTDWPALRAGLRGDDVIVAVGGVSPDVAQRDFMAWFRLAYEPGDTVVLTVRDARGRDREVRYVAAAH